MSSQPKKDPTALQQPGPQPASSVSQTSPQPTLVLQDGEKWTFERDASGRISKITGKGDLGLFTAIFAVIDDLNQTTKKFAKDSSHYAKWLQWLTVALMILTSGLIFLTIFHR